MNTFRILFLFLIFIISTTVLAQSHTEQQNLSFGKGRFKTIWGTKIYFSSVTLGQEVHTYKAKGSNASQTVDIAKVLNVEVQKGSYALKAGVGSAILGLIVSMVFVNSVNESLGYNEASPSIIAGSTAGITLIGVLIGSKFRKYETVHSNPRLSIDMGIIRGAI